MTNLSECDAKSHTWNLNEVKEKYFFSELFTEQYPKATFDVRIHLLTLCLIHVLLFQKKKKKCWQSQYVLSIFKILQLDLMQCYLFKETSKPSMIL